MADKRFEVELPEAVLTGFGWQEVEVPHKVREALVMELLRQDQLSEAQAAELLHLDRWEIRLCISPLALRDLVPTRHTKAGTFCY